MKTEQVNYRAATEARNQIGQIMSNFESEDKKAIFAAASVEASTYLERVFQ